MVVGIFASLAGIVNVNLSKTKVDSGVFQLHYRGASSLCFIACTLVAISDFIGEPINCLGADRLVTTSCWITSTHTLNDTSGQATFYVAYGSNASGIGTPNNLDPGTTVRHSYYQWVPFILFIQGCIFYLPHYVWKNIEGRKINNILQDLGPLSILDDKAEEKKKNLVEYLVRSKGLNQKYWIGYFFCECLNLVSTVLQIFILDAFFNGLFWNLGSSVLSLYSSPSERTDSLVIRFPRFTKCTFNKFGPSGTIEADDYLCVLPQNLLNEKIFVIMWILLIALVAITSISIILRIIQMVFTQLRVTQISLRTKHFPPPENIKNLIQTMKLGDYFLLLSIGRNLNWMCFRDIVEMLSRNYLMKDIDKYGVPRSGSTNVAFMIEDAKNIS